MNCSRVLLLLASLAAPCHAQQLPARVHYVDAPQGLVGLDPATRHLSVASTAPQDLATIGAFRQLQSLAIRQRSFPPPSWADSDALAGLRGCSQLRTLAIGNFWLGNADLAVLEHLPQLQELRLCGVDLVLDAELVDRFAKLDLRKLTLVGLRVDPRGFERLCELPVLEELTFETPLHIGRCDLRALARMRQIRAIGLRNWGNPRMAHLETQHPLPGMDDDDPQPRPKDIQLVDEAVVEILARLPNLQALDLGLSVINDQVLANLPTSLRRLDLGHCIGATSAGIAKLERLAQLRSLRLHTTPNAPKPGEVALQGPRALTHGLIEYLPNSTLEELRLLSGVPRHLAEAIAECPCLRSIEILGGAHDVVDIGFVDKLPSLEQLTLPPNRAADPPRGPGMPPLPRPADRPYDIDALAACESLRRLELIRPSQPFVRALRQRLGERVRIVVR